MAGPVKKNPTPKPTPTRSYDPRDLDKDGLVEIDENAAWTSAQTGGFLPAVTGTAVPTNETAPAGTVLWTGGVATGRPSAVAGKATFKTPKELKNAFKTQTLAPGIVRLINQSYTSYGKALGFKSASSFWSSIVDQGTAETSPLAILDATRQAIENGEYDDTLLTTTGPGSGPSTTLSVQQYDRGTADSIVDAALLAVFGRKASDTEKSRFFSELNSAAMAGTETRTSTKGGKTVVTTTQKFDQKSFIDKYVGTVLEGQLAQGQDIDFGGEAGKYQDALNNYAADMGLFRSGREIVSDVSRIVRGETTIDDITGEMRKQAAVLYKNFADRLNTDPRLTVRDLANPYIKLMADTLELDENNISLTDTTIQGVLNSDKLPSYADVYKQLRQDTRFRNTLTAQREASGLAQGLASAMGF